MKKNAFTLIELLAVIVILAIIALIAVPIVINIINDSKKSSMEESVNMYAKMLEKAAISYFIKYPHKADVELEELEKLIEYNGEKIECETVQIGQKGEIYLSNCKVGGVLLAYEYGTPIYIMKNKNYKGYYADVDGDEEVDGIIYADLAHTASGQWSDSNGTYSYNAKSVLNEYAISKEEYEGIFGKNKIITLKKNKNEKRFYVMALEDFKPETYVTYSWYYHARGNMNPLITSSAFGTGYENTQKMIAKWKAAGTSEGYSDSPQNNKDIWKYIQEKNEKGWYIPSRGEWSAFSDFIVTEKKITFGSSGNYRNYNLRYPYWSSSQSDLYTIFDANFNYGKIFFADANSELYARLGITF